MPFKKQRDPGPFNQFNHESMTPLIHQCEGAMRYSLLFVAVLSLTGCNNIPKNPDELKRFALKDAARNTEHLEIERPLSAISFSFYKKSSECSGGSIRWVSTKGESGVTTYIFTFINRKTHSEIHAQRKVMIEGRIVGAGEPPDGQYRVVLDAIAISENRTGIDLYKLSPIADMFLSQTFAHWARNDTTGCFEPKAILEGAKYFADEVTVAKFLIGGGNSTGESARADSAITNPEIKALKPNVRDLRE